MSEMKNTEKTVISWAMAGRISWMDCTTFIMTVRSKLRLGRSQEGRPEK